MQGAMHVVPCGWGFSSVADFAFDDSYFQEKCLRNPMLDRQRCCRPARRPQSTAARNPGRALSLALPSLLLLRPSKMLLPPRNSRLQPRKQRLARRGEMAYTRRVSGR